MGEARGVWAGARAISPLPSLPQGRQQGEPLSRRNVLSSGQTELVGVKNV